MCAGSRPGPAAQSARDSPARRPLLDQAAAPALRAAGCRASAMSSPPSRYCMRTRRSLSSQVAFSWMASARREERILLLDDSSPISSRLSASERSGRRGVGGTSALLPGLARALDPGGALAVESSIASRRSCMSRGAGAAVGQLDQAAADGLRPSAAAGLAHGPRTAPAPGARAALAAGGSWASLTSWRLDRGARVRVVGILVLLGGAT